MRSEQDRAGLTVPFAVADALQAQVEDIRILGFGCEQTEPGEQAEPGKLGKTELHCGLHGVLSRLKVQIKRGRNMAVAGLGYEETGEYGNNQVPVWKR